MASLSNARPIARSSSPRSSLRGMAESKKYEAAEEAVESAYLEGDVRITFSPGRRQIRSKPKGEQRLTGNRVYYDFSTDRASSPMPSCTPSIQHWAFPWLCGPSSSGRCPSASIRPTRSN